MPYSYPNRVPAVAQHWTESEKKRCARAAQAVLSRGGSEEDAIFACIHAAGRSHHKAKKTYGPTKQQNDQYFNLQDEVRDELEGYGRDYASGALSKDGYEKKMHDKIVEYLTDLAILANDGNDLSEEDVNDLTSYTDDILSLLEDMLIFVEDRDQFSEDYLSWRAGLFSNARQVFIRFTMPHDIWLLLPVLPGDDCLGDGRCGCSWEIEVDDEGNISAYWQLGDTEHCEICIAHSIEYNPFTAEA